MTAATSSQPVFDPRDPNFTGKVRASFANQRVMETLGIHIHDLQPGRIELRMPFAEAFTQQHGFLHAGILTTALDSACGYAAFSLMAAEAEVLTAEFKTNLLAPAEGSEFAFRATVLKPGRTLTVAEARAFSLSGGGEKLVASMTATLMAVYGRSDVQP